MSRSKTERLRRARQKMMADDPHCWYCGIEVIEVEHYQRGRGQPKKPRPGNAATIEHMFHRLKGHRPSQGSWVLACNDCNNERNRYSELLAGLDLLHQRSHPDGIRPAPEWAREIPVSTGAMGEWA